MERPDQHSKLKRIGADVLPERYLDRCVITYYPPEAIVADGDRENDFDVLRPIAEEMRRQGVHVELMPSSIIPSDCVAYYPGRDQIRWVLVALMPSRRAHHAWTQRLIDALGSTAAIRSCMYDAAGNKVRDAMAMRLIGFLPPVFKVKAVGAAVGKRCDGMMKRAEIKRRTDEFYRKVVDGK